MSEFDLPSDPEKGMPETIRFTLPNDGTRRGLFVIFCFENEIEVKARGLEKGDLSFILSEILDRIIK